MTEFLTATEAAQRLGVKPATLYAYVSRGVLRRDRVADGRGSLFEPKRSSGWPGAAVPGARPACRHHGRVGDYRADRRLTPVPRPRRNRLAVTRTFEEVAELLWTGEFPAAHAVPPGRSVPPMTLQATPAALAVAPPRRPRSRPGRCPSNGSRSSCP